MRVLSHTPIVPLYALEVRLTFDLKHLTQVRALDKVMLKALEGWACMWTPDVEYRAALRCKLMCDV